MKPIKMALSHNDQHIDESLTTNLIRKFGLRVNTLQSAVEAGAGGEMIIQMKGEGARISHGVAYLKGLGITVKPLDKKIRHVGRLCASCTACLPHCPTRALDVDRESWRVFFDDAACCRCRICLAVCIYGALRLA